MIRQCFLFLLPSPNIDYEGEHLISYRSENLARHSVVDK